MLAIMILQGCSGAWHLKQAVKKGIVVKSDTVYQDVITKGSKTVVHDTITKTVFLDKIFRDTLITENVKWKSKLIYDTIHNTVYQQVECKPDTIRVPVQVNNDFQDVIDQTPWWKWVLIAIIVILVLVFVIKVVQK